MPTPALDAILRLLALIPQWPAITYPLASFVLVGVGVVIRKYCPARRIL